MSTRTSARRKPVATSSVSIGIDTPTFGFSDGIGGAAEALALALQSCGAEVSLLGSPALCPFGTTFASNATRPVEAVISFQQPPRWRRIAGKPLIGVITSADAIGAAEQTAFALADHLLCPSAWSLYAARAAMTTSVSAIPLGLECSVFTPLLRTRAPKLKVLFLARHVAADRKGLDVAINSFRAAFGARSDVELLVHSMVRNTIEGMGEQVRMSYGPRSPRALSQLLRSADVLLYTSRAEAFATVALEAIATGIPIIHTGMTGMADFTGIGKIAASRATPMLNGDERHEPLMDSLVARLREFDERYETIADTAASDAGIVSRKWSMDETAAAICSRLGA